MAGDEVRGITVRLPDGATGRLTLGWPGMRTVVDREGCTWDDFYDALPDEAIVIHHAPFWVPVFERTRSLMWLTWLANLPPEPDVVAQHICKPALEEFAGMLCRVICRVATDGEICPWELQRIEDGMWGQTNEDIFGDGSDSFFIDYCPWCGEKLPEGETDA